MKLMIAASIVFAGCTCQPVPPPPAPVPTPTPAMSVVVYQELVEAGVLAPDDDGPAAIDEEHKRSDQPAWLACLYDGGTTQGCNVPTQ